MAHCEPARRELAKTHDELWCYEFVRLLLTYHDAPYKLLPGGTGEAVIGPIFEALRANGVQIHLGASVTGLVLDNTAAPLARAIEFVQVQQADPAGEFARWGPATREGWVARAARPLPGSEEKATADVFVLAIPPLSKNCASSMATTVVWGSSASMMSAARKTGWASKCSPLWDVTFST